LNSSGRATTGGPVPGKGAIMAEYTYLDIFATKGLEYMVVLAYFILFVIFSKNLVAPKKDSKKPTGKEK
jgi:hypothetical protein